MPMDPGRVDPGRVDPCGSRPYGSRPCGSRPCGSPWMPAAGAAQGSPCAGLGLGWQRRARGALPGAELPPPALPAPQGRSSPRPEPGARSAAPACRACPALPVLAIGFAWESKSEFINLNLNLREASSNILPYSH
ncbi:basic proline-rich protein-like isoform X2 [Cyanistes caeruleus]|uniref:basic proline-rich protein-like isoform X2 n=1 Tax=Cyanistes caeruleus TaxID=156563 RepID=UPI000CDAB3D2|nr:basic proline-rich protein-like isoform X2 [Cyanistes caeruleus]